jgi:hypothetical protein
VTIDGLTMKRSHFWPGTANGVVIGAVHGVVVRNCTFYDLNGFGINMTTLGTNIHIERNLFVGSDAIMCVPWGVGDIVGNTFAQSRLIIGGVGPATPKLTGNIFSQTRISCGEGAAPTFTCNDSWQSTYEGICSNPTGTDNNFSADPLFCDPSSRNYGLLPGSPCLPENSPAGCGLIGALGSCDVLAVDEPANTPALSHLEVSPNPSSGEVVFSIPDVSSPRTLEIFDAQGRQVDVLRPIAGQITWNPSRDLTRGIYFARVTSPNPAVVKFVLLR